jgi:hypothetical protein
MLSKSRLEDERDMSPAMLALHANLFQNSSGDFLKQESMKGASSSPITFRRSGSHTPGNPLGTIEEIQLPVVLICRNEQCLHVLDPI